MNDFARHSADRFCLAICMETSRRQPVVIEYFGGNRSVMLGDDLFLSLTPERLAEMQVKLRSVRRLNSATLDAGLGLRDSSSPVDALQRHLEV